MDWKIRFQYLLLFFNLSRKHISNKKQPYYLIFRMSNEYNYRIQPKV